MKVFLLCKLGIDKNHFCQRKPEFLLFYKRTSADLIFYKRRIEGLHSQKTQWTSIIYGQKGLLPQKSKGQSLSKNSSWVFFFIEDQLGLIAYRRLTGFIFFSLNTLADFFITADQKGLLLQKTRGSSIIEGQCCFLHRLREVSPP